MQGGSNRPYRSPQDPLELTEEERAALQRNLARRKSAHQVVVRSQMVLACADGNDHKTVAAELGLTAHTVGKWRPRFVTSRLDGPHDEPRPGAPSD